MQNLNPNTIPVSNLSIDTPNTYIKRQIGAKLPTNEPQSPSQTKEIVCPRSPPSSSKLFGRQLQAAQGYERGGSRVADLFASPIPKTGA